MSADPEPQGAHAKKGELAPSRLPTGVPKAKRAFGSHGARRIEASNLADVEEMRTRVKRKRMPCSIAVIGPQGSGKTSLIKTLASQMSVGVEEQFLPTQTGTGLNSTVVYSRHMAISIIDTPGDPSRRREVLTALTQCDFAILVVSSIPEEWKASTEGGEWQEYVKLLRAADKDDNVFTVVNKIDAGYIGSNPANTAQSRYMRCAMPLRRYFEKILRGVRSQDGRSSGVCKNHKGSAAKWAKNRMFCCSATEDLNVNSFWKEGPTNIANAQLRLGGCLNRFLNGFGETGYALSMVKTIRPNMDRIRKAALRVLIDDVYFGEDGYVAVGKISSGTLRVGEEINIAPGGVVTTAKAIKFQNADADAPGFSPNRAVAGERVEITIGEKGLSANMIFPGSVMGRVTDKADAPETVVDFEATVKILEDAKDWSINVPKKPIGSLFRGEETTEQSFDFALGSYGAYFEDLLAIINPRTKRVVIDGPVEATAGQTVKTHVKLSGPGIPLDEYNLYPDTGRFIVRSDQGTGRIVAVGRITSKEHL